MSNLTTLPKGDSAWLLRKSIQRIMQQVSVLETNIGSSTTGNSSDTQVIFNDNGVLRGDAGLTYNAATDLLSVGAATITGDLTVATDRLKVNTGSTAVQIGSTTQTQIGTTAWPTDLISKASSRVLIGNLGTSIFWNESSPAIGNASTLYIGAKTGAGATTFGGGYISAGTENASDRAGFLAVSTFQSNGIDRERYRIDSTGVHTWQYVGGVAGTAMTLNATGLGVGASPATRLHISNTGDVYARIATTSVSKAGVQFSANGVVRSHLLYDDGAGTTYLTTGTAFGGSGQALAIQSGTSLSIYTNNQLATAQLTLDSSGNVGIGVTPSAWGSTYRALQIGLGTSLTGLTNDVDVNLVNNARFDGTNWKYTNSSPAERYRTASGTHYWYNAASGTAGNNVTWTQSMTLESTGSLVLGAAAVATTATDGFLYIPGCAGTPTGTPTAKTGRVPLVVDTTNNKLYFYSGGAWVAAN